jgi:hypothetical protein
MSEIRASRLADLWTRYLGGQTLAADEEAQLSEAFASDEVFRRRVLYDRRLDGALRAAGDLERRQPELLESMEQLVQAAARSDGFVERMRLRLATEPVVRRAASRRAIFAGAAAAAAVAAVFLAWPRRTPQRPTAARPAAHPTAMGRSVARPPADRAVVATGPAQRAALLIAADAPARTTGAADELLRTRLEQLGFGVDVVATEDHEPVARESVDRAQVVVLSPSIYTDSLTDELVALPVPMVALESSAFTRLGLTGPVWKRDLGPADQRYREVLITNAGHPLAAGLTGQPTVLDHRLGLRWGLPGEEAINVAHFPGSPVAESAFFAYERGSQMPGGRAAARRVAIFLGNSKVIRALTSEGWRLFDAAVTWSVADSR